MIIYIKPVLLGDEPVDVTNYAAATRKVGGKFPHDTTADQFFDESQFESYRMLGRISIEALQKEALQKEALQKEALQKGVLAAIKPPSDSELTRRAGEKPDVKAESEDRDLRMQPSVRANGGWMGGLLRPAAALAGAAALTTAIATTVALTVSGSVQLEPPTNPVPVSGELRLNTDDRKVLEGLTFNEKTADRDQRGLRVNEKDVEALKAKVDLSPEARKQLEKGVPVTVSVGPVKLESDQVFLREKFVSVTPKSITLSESKELTELEVALRDAAEKLNEGVVKKLDSIDATLVRIENEVTDAPPRRNVKGVKGE